MDVLIALALSTFAGLSTVIGGASVFLFKKPKMSYLSLVLGLSAGVMIYVAFVDFLPRSVAATNEILTIITFFGGMLLILVIDFIIPEFQNPHHPHTIVTTNGSQNNQRLMKTGAFTALTIALHNLPEGLITFGAALSDIRLGIIISIAIALHNIPEGLSVTIPIYHATQNRQKAMLYAFFSGVAEPIGAIIGLLILLPFFSDFLLGGLLGVVAGIMVYISLDELLPTAEEYGEHHLAIGGLIVCMIIMAISLLLFI